MSARLYGLAEIAEALGVPVTRVRDWREAGRLPGPTQQLRMGYVWAAEDIEWWIREKKEPYGTITIGTGKQGTEPVTLAAVEDSLRGFDGRGWG